MLTFCLYLISVVDSINFVLGLIGIVASTILPIFILANVVDTNEMTDKAKYFLKKCFIVSMTSLMLWGIIPNKETLAALYVLPTILESDNIYSITGKDTHKLRELAKQYLFEVVKKK